MKNIYLNHTKVGQTFNPAAAADKLVKELKKKGVVATREDVLSKMQSSRNAFSVFSWDFPVLPAVSFDQCIIG